MYPSVFNTSYFLYCATVVKVRTVLLFFKGMGDPLSLFILAYSGIVVELTPLILCCSAHATLKIGTIFTFL